MTDFAYTVQVNPYAPPKVPSQAGSWGLGGYGVSGYGSVGEAPPPALLDLEHNVADVEGGTLLVLLGTGFADPMLVELLSAGEVVGLGVIGDPRYDLTENMAYAGMPALAAGFYDLRVTTSGGSAVLTNAIEFRPFALEGKVEAARRKWGAKWNLGARL